MGRQLEIDQETEGILSLWKKFTGTKHLDLFLWISNLERNGIAAWVLDSRILGHMLLGPKLKDFGGFWVLKSRGSTRYTLEYHKYAAIFLYCQNQLVIVTF